MWYKEVLAYFLELSKSSESFCRCSRRPGSKKSDFRYKEQKRRIKTRLDSLLRWIPHSTTSNIYCWICCISKLLTMIFQLRIRNESSLTNTSSGAQSCFQYSGMFCCLSNRSWELSIQDLQLPKLLSSMRKISSLVNHIRAFLELPTQFEIITWPYISRCCGHILCAEIRGSDNQNFVQLMNRNRRAHGFPWWSRWAFCTEGNGIS